MTIKRTDLAQTSLPTNMVVQQINNAGPGLVIIMTFKRSVPPSVKLFKIISYHNRPSSNKNQEKEVTKYYV